MANKESIGFHPKPEAPQEPVKSKKPLLKKEVIGFDPREPLMRKKRTKSPPIAGFGRELSSPEDESKEESEGQQEKEETIANLIPELMRLEAEVSYLLDQKFNLVDGRYMEIFQEIEDKREVLDLEMMNMGGVEIQSREECAARVATKENQLRRVLRAVNRLLFSKVELLVQFFVIGTMRKDELFNNLVTEKEAIQKSLDDIREVIRNWKLDMPDARDATGAREENKNTTLAA